MGYDTLIQNPIWRQGANQMASNTPRSTSSILGRGMISGARQYQDQQQYQQRLEAQQRAQAAAEETARQRAALPDFIQQVMGQAPTPPQLMQGAPEQMMGPVPNEAMLGQPMPNMNQAEYSQGQPGSGYLGSDMGNQARSYLLSQLMQNPLTAKMGGEMLKQDFQSAGTGQNQMALERLKQMQPKEQSGVIGQYLFARDQGYEGSLIDFKEATKAAGVNVNVGGALPYKIPANYKPNPKAGQPGEPDVVEITGVKTSQTQGTSEQQKLASFLRGMEDSIATMRDTETKGFDPNSLRAQSASAAGRISDDLANFIRTPQGQIFKAAQLKFQDAILRMETGATKSEMEIVDKARQLEPQLFDSPEQAQYKKDEFTKLIAQWKIAAGPAYVARDVVDAQPVALPAGYIQPPNTEIWTNAKGEFYDVPADDESRAIAKREGLTRRN